MQASLARRNIFLIHIAFIMMPLYVLAQSGRTATGDYEVGKLIRPISGISWMGQAYYHHDVLVRNGSSHTRRGFFATSFVGAIAGADTYLNTPWYVPFREDVGWVSGYIADQGEWGSEAMTRVDEARYQTVKTRILSCTSNKYHLIKFSCQEWASQKLAP